MKNFDKLFIHLFTQYIEQYRDTKIAVKTIDNILSKDENYLLNELQDAFRQANRLNLFDEKALPYSAELSEEVIIKLKEDVPLETLRSAMNKYLKSRSC